MLTRGMFVQKMGTVENGTLRAFDVLIPQPRCPLFCIAPVTVFQYRESRVLYLFNRRHDYLIQPAFGLADGESMT